MRKKRERERDVEINRYKESKWKKRQKTRTTVISCYRKILFSNQMRVKKMQLCIKSIEEGKAGCKMRGWLVKNTRQRARDRVIERERESTLRVGGF